MSNADDDALSTVDAHHQAWTSGDVREGQIVEIRLAFDRLGYVPQQQQPA